MTLIGYPRATTGEDPDRQAQVSITGAKAMSKHGSSLTNGGFIAGTQDSITSDGTIVAFDGTQRIAFTPSNSGDSITVIINSRNHTITAVQNKTSPT